MMKTVIITCVCLKSKIVFFNLMRVTRLDEILNIKVNTKNKIGQILRQFEKIENYKVICNDSVIYK